jgi:hypothetical protein
VARRYGAGVQARGQAENSSGGKATIRPDYKTSSGKRIRYDNFCFEITRYDGLHEGTTITNRS